MDQFFLECVELHGEVAKLKRELSKVLSTICGFSRMGPNRELKTRLEAFWEEQAQLRGAGAQNAKLADSIAQFEHDIEELQLQRWQSLEVIELVFWINSTLAEF